MLSSAHLRDWRGLVRRFSDAANQAGLRRDNPAAGVAAPRSKRADYREDRVSWSAATAPGSPSTRTAAASRRPLK